MIVGTGDLAHDGVGQRPLAGGEVVTCCAEAAGITFTVLPSHDGVHVVVAEGLVELGKFGGAPSVPFAVAVLEFTVLAGSVVGAGIGVSLPVRVRCVVAVD